MNIHFVQNVGWNLMFPRIVKNIDKKVMVGQAREDLKLIQTKNTLLCEVTINSICQSFFFLPHLRIKSKASAYMSRHLHIKSKTSAYTIGTCFRFHMQMPLDI